MRPTSLFFWKRFLKRLSVRAGLFAIFACGVALCARALAPYVPADFTSLVGGKAVDNVLTIIASSMLAVVTFSLSIMVSAYATASTSTTPRATTLLIEDSAAQNALSTFLGAFIFSIVGLVALSTGFYGAEGRVILFMTTAVLVAMVVATIVRWIDQLTNLGRVRYVITRIEETTTSPLRKRLQRPTLGCQAFTGAPPKGTALYCERTGFVQTINFKTLNQWAKKHEATVYLTVDLGVAVHHRSVLAIIVSRTDTPQWDAGFSDEFRANFAIGPMRTFEDDPTYGLLLLSEVACRALSPAVNDPGTAIDVIVTSTRILTEAMAKEATEEADDQGETYDQVYLRPISLMRCLEDSFDAVARDGARQVEVAMRLQQAFQALASLGDEQLEDASRRLAARSLQRCKLGMELPEDYQRVAACALPQS